MSSLMMLKSSYHHQPLHVSYNRQQQPSSFINRCCCCFPSSVGAARPSLKLSSSRLGQIIPKATAGGRLNDVLRALLDIPVEPTGGFLEKPFQFSTVATLFASGLVFSLIYLLLKEIYDSLPSSSPFETSVFGAILLPLQAIVSIFTVSFVSRPWMITKELKFMASARNHITVLAVVWFLYRWKNCFIRNTLDAMIANRSNPDDIAGLKALSTFVSIYLAGFAFYQLLGEALEYSFWIFTVGVPTLFLVGNIRSYLMSSLFKQRSQQHISTGDLNSVLASQTSKNKDMNEIKSNQEKGVELADDIYLVH